MYLRHMITEYMDSLPSHSMILNEVVALLHRVG
jgi:hypothetical protein